MLVKINWNPDKKQLLNFGLFMLIALPICGALLAWRFHTLTPLYWLAGIGAAIELSCILLPSMALWIYKAWMGLGFCMGTVMAPIALSIAYFFVFTPMGILLRLFGKDTLQQHKKNEATYWQEVKHRANKESYERQF